MAAWSSAKGFHHGSHMTTVLAHVRLRPTPHLVRVRVQVGVGVRVGLG